VVATSAEIVLRLKAKVSDLLVPDDMGHGLRCDIG
jgi:hypothetical protein